MCHIHLNSKSHFPHLFIGDINVLSELFGKLNEKLYKASEQLVGSQKMFTPASKLESRETLLMIYEVTYDWSGN